MDSIPRIKLEIEFGGGEPMRLTVDGIEAAPSVDRLILLIDPSIEGGFRWSWGMSDHPGSRKVIEDALASEGWRDFYGTEYDKG